MNTTNKALFDFLQKRDYRTQRKEIENVQFKNNTSVTEKFETVKTLIESEVPVIFDNDDIGFYRHNKIVVPSFGGGNFTANYGRVISEGFDSISEKLKHNMTLTSDAEKLEFGSTLLKYIEMVCDFCERYRVAAVEKGSLRLAKALETVPRKPASSFYEACVFMKICTFFLRYCYTCHVTLGRFDQYMYPFYLADKEKGVTDDEIYNTLENFFISLNFDIDLFTGVQQGDNGQSMVLAGFDKDGKYLYNELSQMCMDASLDLKLIDPKINLRVGKDTPIEIFENAMHLTKAGLGFPQFCNDDVVVKGLTKLGYAPEHARDYTVAACWEYIIPGLGTDIPNIGVMDFPKVVNNTVTESLMSCESFSEFMEHVKCNIENYCDKIIDEAKNYHLEDLTFGSVFIDGCIEKLCDCYRGGALYNNYGFHGAGISNAADALAAVKKTIFDDKTVSKSDLLKALENNFDGFSELRNLLRSCPKMGNNDDYVDDIACEIMSIFSHKMNGADAKNGRGGICRAGTGSAMEYIYKGEACPATADGRLAFQPYASSFSPSLDAKTDGLLSVIQSFTKYDMSEIINGGPLTVEVHDTVLRNEDGMKKLAQLVKIFIDLGGHQLQLNSISRERLLDAQKHPENYANLIVRVWGWSGYFNELDVKYQNHIIRRTEYGV